MPHTPAPTGIIRIDPDSLKLEPLDLDLADFQSPLPVQHYAPVFEDDAIGLAIGIWDTTTMQEAFGPYPGDEYITVLDGHFAMVDAADGVLATARAGDSVTFRNGAPASWKQDGYLRKLYLTLKHPSGAVPVGVPAAGAFRAFGPDRRPQGTPDADGVTREVVFANDAGSLTVTLCAFPAGALPPAPSPAHRLLRVLAGHVALTEPGALPTALVPGAHAFLPRGTPCAWACTPGTVVVVIDVTAP